MLKNTGLYVLIENRLKEMNIKQPAAAAELKLSARQYRRIIKNEALNTEQLFKLCRFLGLSLHIGKVLDGGKWLSNDLSK